MRTDRRDRGFTLTELMTVVAILGVLTALAVPTYRGLTAQATEAVLVENARTLETKVRLLLQEDSYDLTFRNRERHDPDRFLSRRIQEDLEASAIELVDTTVEPLKNPVSGNENVMLRGNPNTNKVPTPPAVFVTGSRAYRHERVRQNARRLAGSLVIVIDKQRSRVEVYYMDVNGLPSDEVATVEAE